MKREIVPDQPDFLFVNAILARDESFILGFRLSRPYEVEFEIEETPDDDETIAEDCPRNLQVITKDSLTFFRLETRALEEFFRFL